MSSLAQSLSLQVLIVVCRLHHACSLLGCMQAVLEGVGGPLLCTSVHVPEILAPDTEVPDAGQMLELYGGR